MNMEKLLSTSDPAGMLVAEYLKKYSEEHNWNRVEETQRTIDQCYNYIYDRAHKCAPAGARSIMIKEDEVYKWAVEFYNSDNVQAATPEPVKATSLEPKPKKEKKVVRKEPEDEQLSLFD